MIKDTTEVQEQFPNTNIVGVEQVTERGLVNEVYIVTTSRDKYVLRVDPEEEDLERFKKEKWCTDIALEKGIFTPKIYKIGQREDKHPYMIMEYIEGEDGDNAIQYKNDIWNALGRYAKTLHSISVMGYGGTMDQPGIFRDNWDEFLNYNISQLTPKDKAISLGAITLEESIAIKDIFQRIKGFNINFGLSHYDLAPKNTRVDKDGNVYLIDWGSASVLPAPYLDIAEILDESLEDTSIEFRDFLHGYGLTYDQYLEIKPLVNQLNLLMYIDKLRWAIDKRPERIDHFVKEVKEKIKKVI